MQADAPHVPVMLERIVELLAPALRHSGATAIDAAVGMGGHAEALLRECPQARVVGVDRDRDALRHAADRLQHFGSRFVPVQAVYDDIGAVAAEHTPDGLSVALFDLGISSRQVDLVERGFAYAVDAPLDMRMDQGRGQRAADVLNTYPEGELSRILREYGQERFAARIAAAIVRERDHAPFESSARLVEVLRSTIPAASVRTGGHPAKRTFQALRMEVNDELGALRRALPAAVELVGVGGRIAVLSYHSLEDREVKQTFVRGSTSSAPRGLPVELPEHRPSLRLLTRGAEKPSEAQIQTNPRAASARLRAVERIKEAA